MTRSARSLYFGPVRSGYTDPARFLPVTILIAIIALTILFWPRSRTSSESVSAVGVTKEEEKPKAEASTDDHDDKAAKKSAKSDESKLPVVEINTTLGKITCRLFADKAPKTVKNFLDLVDKKFYDGIIVHRVVDNFMIQTGDPLGTGTGGRTDKGLPPQELEDEFHPDLRHSKPGLLSMANSGPNTGDTQFFITLKDTSWLDNKHAIFGEVIDGMDVVKKIGKLPTRAGGGGESSRPIDPPKMLTVRLKGADGAKEETPATEPPQEETAKEEAPKEEPAKEEQPTKEEPAKEEPAKEPAKEEPAPAKEEPKQKPAKEEPAKEESKKEPVKSEPAPAKEEPTKKPASESTDSNSESKL